MKIAIFALDEIFGEWDQITCKELCELYAKFGRMYIISRQESYAENDLKIFEVVISAKSKLVIDFEVLTFFFIN